MVASSLEEIDVGGVWRLEVDLEHGVDRSQGKEEAAGTAASPDSDG